ncbi:hypothetical protein GUJ93_ZPchr0458g22812 [Zizania palustris]|uniref:DNA-directed RNA polymerase subunit beta n=1 Tax=Zizania palustris TaxID=103762 RepID=A0A8J5RE10_ZIZPA|nr:hypothetical protein GUJ93_ZPchr0458g22812 [Zizania palustris]
MLTIAANATSTGDTIHVFLSDKSSSKKIKSRPRGGRRRRGCCSQSALLGFCPPAALPLRVIVGCACAMEEPPKDNGQSPRGSDPELEPMMLEDDGEGKSHTMDDANGHSSMDVDRGYHSLDIIGSSLDDDGKGKRDSYAHVSIDMSIPSIEKFCKEASRSFFDEISLISHQINSYNEFVSHGLQGLFDSLGEVIVEPSYDPSNRGPGGWRHAIIKFGTVKLEEPVFWARGYDIDEESLKLKPRHARLQNMTYSSKMKVEVNIQVYSMEKSEKAKTGNDHFGYKKNITNETHIINIGRLPVMVKSNLCWLHKLKESDCQFDLGGYFLIKGMEKVFIAQEQRCLTRIWVDDRPCLTVSFLSEIRRRRISSDKAVFDMIDMQDCDACVINTITTTIKESDELCEGFRKTDKARQYVDELIKNSKFPPAESFDDYIDKYMFPSITGKRNKALFLGYMVKCLLMAFTGKRKCDNRDDFRNKRLELAGQLLAREFRAHIRHAERLMVKALQRDLNTDRDFHDLDRYLDASIITNGLNRAFSTGSWCHPYKRNERCSGIVATLRRTNPLQMTSDLRKTRQQVAYAGKAGDARYPNPSYWGKLCFMSTPDGENCGLVKNLAVTAIVSSRVDQPLIDSFISCGMIKLHEIPTDEVPRMDKIFLNGDWVGSCTDPASFVLRLRCMRRSGLINSQVEIKRDKHQREVRVFSDAGRILRPLLVVENLDKIRKPKGGSYSFQALVQQEIIEFIGVEEEEDIQSAWEIKHLFESEGEEATLSGDIIIGKVSESGEDHSIKLKHTEKGMVQRVLLSANDEGKNFAVVTLRQVRTPCLGDKFSSMHGQKGVIGFLESQENFPFTCQGIVPDIVINPHAFPTRQTPGQLLEAALGKGIALGATMRYATPFTTASVDVISDQLHKFGFSRWGAESVLNGRTGERMNSLIFMGPTFYQRLIHMAEDKVKFRNTGPVHPLTRQPVADRKRFGGVKFGEMERDCLLAHGAAANLHERLFMLSDFSQMHICQTCERAANVVMRPVPGGKKIRGPYCGFCRSSENIVRINVPYGAKLLYQELFSMGICLKFETEVC